MPNELSTGLRDPDGLFDTQRDAPPFARCVQRVFERTTEYVVRGAVASVLDVVRDLLPEAPMITAAEGQTGGSGGGYVIGADERIPLTLKAIPSFAASNKLLKKLAKHMASGEDMPETGLRVAELFLCTVIGSCRRALHPLRALWKEEVLPTLEVYSPSTALECRRSLETAIGNVERIVEEALLRIVKYAGARMQAAAMGLQSSVSRDAGEGNSRDDALLLDPEASDGCRAACREFRAYAELLASPKAVLSAETKAAALVNLCLTLRDVALAPLRSAKVSTTTGLGLMRDMDLYASAASSSAASQLLPGQVHDAMQMLRQIPQVFVVQAEAVLALGLDLSAELTRELVKRRA